MSMPLSQFFLSPALPRRLWNRNLQLLPSPLYPISYRIHLNWKSFKGYKEYFKRGMTVFFSILNKACNLSKLKSLGNCYGWFGSNGNICPISLISRVKPWQTKGWQIFHWFKNVKVRKRITASADFSHASPQTRVKRPGYRICSPKCTQQAEEDNILRRSEVALPSTKPEPPKVLEHYE